MAADPLLAAAAAQASAAHVQAIAAISQAVAAFLSIFATLSLAFVSERRARQVRADEDEREQRRDNKLKTRILSSQLEFVKGLLPIISILDDAIKEAKSELKVLGDASVLECPKQIRKIVLVYEMANRIINSLDRPAPIPNTTSALIEIIMLTITPTKEFKEARNVSEAEASFDHQLMMNQAALKAIEGQLENLRKKLPVD